MKVRIMNAGIKFPFNFLVNPILVVTIVQEYLVFTTV
jgi:hypothetical protein